MALAAPRGVRASTGAAASSCWLRPEARAVPDRAFLQLHQLVILRVRTNKHPYAMDGAARFHQELRELQPMFLTRRSFQFHQREFNALVV